MAKLKVEMKIGKVVMELAAQAEVQAGLFFDFLRAGRGLLRGDGEA
jgi:hypothetical protein